MRAGVSFADDAPFAAPRLSRAEALNRLRDRLARAGIETAEREAEWLLLHALGIGRAAYWSDPLALLRPEETTALEALASRRERREPLQLILGDMPFHDVWLDVEPGVFLPRPETELLIEAILAALHASSQKTPAAAERRTLLDWGTGGGAIAVALLRALPGWTGVGADCSRIALALAARNADRNGVANRFKAVEANLGSSRAPVIPGAPFHLVVSNPPYVRRGTLPGLMPEVRNHDPVEALDGGRDGLDAFRHLARGLGSWLRPGGLLALEMGADQADDVLGAFSAQIQDARVLPDRAGLPRFVIGTMRGGKA